MSCPWVSHCAGGGVVTYRLPRSTKLCGVLADFCHLADISLRRATVKRARLFLASDFRDGCCDGEELDDNRTLEYLKVTSGSVLLVCVAPTVKDLAPTGSLCGASSPGNEYPRRRPPGGGARGGGGGSAPGFDGAEFDEEEEVHTEDEVEE
ncbi:unnamed protein product [Ectocarpus fasciculatus]